MKMKFQSVQKIFDRLRGKDKTKRKAKRAMVEKMGDNHAIFNEMQFEVVPNSFWKAFNSGAWEIETREFFKAHTSPDKEIIDIGGWIGPTMLIGYSCNPRKITVVEADPANFQILKKNCRRNFLDDKVELHCVCIFDKTDEIVSFGYNDENVQDSSTKGIGGERIKVKTITLRDFLRTKDMENTSIVKIDIEGGEQFIGEGLDYIAQFPQINTLLSLHPPFWKDKQETTNMLLEKLKDFSIWLDTGEEISLEKLKILMLDETRTIYEGKTGLFFSVILRAN